MKSSLLVCTKPSLERTLQITSGKLNSTMVIPFTENEKGELEPSFLKHISREETTIDVTTLSNCRHYMVVNGKLSAPQEDVRIDSTFQCYEHIDYWLDELPVLTMRSSVHPIFRRQNFLRTSYMLALIDRQFQASVYRHPIPTVRDVKNFIALPRFLGVPDAMHDNVCNLIALTNPIWKKFVSTSPIWEMLAEYDALDSERDAEVKGNMLNSIRELLRNGEKLYAAEKKVVRT